VTFSVDHIIPGSKGGTNELDNLAWSCLQCNNHKKAAVQYADPETGLLVPLFNPRLQNWSDNFGWKNLYTEIVGITPIGLATLERLKLNRIGLVSLRKLMVETDCHPDAPNYSGNWTIQ
jgi:HNH endonuclease